MRRTTTRPIPERSGSRQRASTSQHASASVQRSCADHRADTNTRSECRRGDLNPHALAGTRPSTLLRSPDGSHPGPHQRPDQRIRRISFASATPRISLRPAQSRSVSLGARRKTHRHRARRTRRRLGGLHDSIDELLRRSEPGRAGDQLRCLGSASSTASPSICTTRTTRLRTFTALRRTRSQGLSGDRRSDRGLAPPPSHPPCRRVGRRTHRRATGVLGTRDSWRRARYR